MKTRIYAAPAIKGLIIYAEEKRNLKLGFDHTLSFLRLPLWMFIAFSSVQ